ncbi:hypothetical protein BC834DRAFT_925973 [Gloeopeniophorella convolvens]|nr:hypothetical protein BC834DRAFT_925973 [Gloeopeniophorella convolvens]
MWLHPLLIPSYVAGASAVVFIFQTCVTYGLGAYRRARIAPTPGSDAPFSPGPSGSARLPTAYNEHVRKAGGSTIFYFKFARLLGVLGLFGLYLADYILHRKSHNQSVGRKYGVIKPTLCAAYLYASILSLFTVAATRRLSVIASKHLSVVLLATLLLYIYRDIWPLLTFTLVPADRAEGFILWFKMTLLAFVTVVVPLAIPRQYTPYDPKDPAPIPHPEQTGSIFSMAIHSYLSSLIWKAYRVPHLGHDQLPPNADYDRAKNLVEGAFPPSLPIVHLTSKDASLFVLRRSSAGSSALSHYIETDGRDTLVRPWVWIAGLAVGPTLGAIAFQWYGFLSTGNLVRIEGILTQLLLEHALRLRVKAETKQRSSSPQALSVEATTPGNDSEADLHAVEGRETVALGTSSNSEGDTVSVQSSSVKGKQRVGPEDAKAVSAEVPAAPVQDEKGGDFAGKINTLASTDLGNITGGRDFLMYTFYAPLQIIISVCFLYNILGWSTFVGMFFMIALTPLPGLVTKLIHTTQQEAMKKTEVRVQTVTEVMGVMRMIKSFAWESRVEEKITSKREDELRWIKRQKLLGYFNIMLNDSASKVFGALSVFDIMRGEISIVFWILPELISSKVSLDRFTAFLREVKLYRIIPSFSTNTTRGSVAQPPAHSRRLRANFTWSKDEADGRLTPSRKRFVLRVPDETSLLMALLGEMHFISTQVDSWFHLPRTNGVSYAAQESWVQNETIRANILFGAPYDEERYNKVIYQCGLQQDLSLFEAGDLTEVGEKGLTLRRSDSAAKARVTLARAVYSSAEILLLDDVLAALDVHTAKWVVNKCFKGDLIKGRTVLLVASLADTQCALVSSLADYVISLGGGQIMSCGTVSDALSKDKSLSADFDVEKPDEAAKKSAGKLILEEETQEGHLSMDVSLVLETWFMGYWSEQYIERDPGDVSLKIYLSIYCLIVVSTVALFTIEYTTYVFGTVRASVVSMRSSSILSWAQPCAGSIVFFTPIFIFPGFVVFAVGGWCGNVYMKAQLSVKREMSKMKAPMLGHFGAAITGLVSIRAYGAQEAFRQESYNRIDNYTRAARVFYNLNRWIGIRMECLSGAFTAGLAAWLVYSPKSQSYLPSDTGFSLTMAGHGLQRVIVWLVRAFNEFEVSGNSLERMKSYIDIEQEPKSTESGKPPAYWPSSGDLRVEKLCARYSPDGPEVLHNLSFHIKSGERVGIVGRTGSGKSSLTLSLLRCIITEGDVYYDNILTKDINLHALRSNVTIIPQMPELLSGTLRENLDPFSQFDDVTLNGALRAAGLFSLLKDGDEARITLDSQVANGGGNLSVGQRQILALARALIRGSKLFILDEATSAVDYDTDTIIQNSLRTELKSDVTLITIAHRLQTIMDADKIMVLDAGRIVEFGRPSELLKNSEGRLRAMVDESGDRDALYKMVAQKEQGSSAGSA